VLIGPTGAGKTPLGELLDARGLAGRRCHHFDFGQALRKADRTPQTGLLSPQELQVVRLSLRTGALLEDDQFPIARKILCRFLESRDPETDELVVLNGLPRHVGQARELGGLLDISLVVHLSCTAEVIFERIATDAGGDRAGRTDDDMEAVRRRLVTFRRRTAPLLDYYQGKAAIATLEIAEDTSAEDAWRMLNDQAEELLQRKR